METEGSIGESHGSNGIDVRSSVGHRHLALLFHALIRICQITEKILHSLWVARYILHVHVILWPNLDICRYAPKPRCRGSQLSVFLESCSLELKTWFYDLPSELRADTPSHRVIPQAYTLLMVYYTTNILLVKPFVKRSNSSSPLWETASAETSNFIKKCETTLEESAKKTCAIARKYQRSVGTFRLSAATATHCVLTAATVFLRLYPDLSMHAKPQVMNNLQVVLDVLDELSTAWHMAHRLRRSLLNLISSRKGMYGEKAKSPTPAFESSLDHADSGDASITAAAEGIGKEPLFWNYNDIAMSTSPSMENADSLFTNSTWEQFGFGFMSESFLEECNNDQINMLTL